MVDVNNQEALPITLAETTNVDESSAEGETGTTDKVAEEDQ